MAESGSNEEVRRLVVNGEYVAWTAAKSTTFAVDDRHVYVGLGTKVGRVDKNR